MRALLYLVLSVLFGSTTIAPVAGCGGCYDEDSPTSLSPSTPCLTVVAATGSCSEPRFTVINECQEPVIVMNRGTRLLMDTEIAAGETFTVLVVADPSTSRLPRTFDLEVAGEPHTLTVEW